MLDVLIPNVFLQADICAVKGSLKFLVEMLRFLDAPSKTLAIVENAGGILRNISSHIAVREDYRLDIITIDILYHWTLFVAKLNSVCYIWRKL